LLRCSDHTMNVAGRSMFDDIDRPAE